MFVLLLLLLSTLFSPRVFAQVKSRTVNSTLNADLKKQATSFDRCALLPYDSDWQYDFSLHPNYNSQTGAVIVADAASFPALTEQGMTISLLKLAGCGMLAPHLHPRATNLVTAITGNTTTWMVGENGVRTVRTELTSMKMTIFPKGSIHAMQNNDCEPALLISALNTEDTGTLNVMNALWTMPQHIVQAAFGASGINAQDIGKNIPAVGTGAIIGSEECKQRCGIKD
ncbi:RmlC-like cupin domain-containing protein [Phaeosphaeria sp. MPI-PUGE-AT-0046c]|nr:RmlC-like cupin domain-containing protein [Phaeosphaeria sp. MPI-PUGE-AT-0046c]